MTTEQMTETEEQTEPQETPVAQAVAETVESAVASIDLSTPEAVRKASEQFPAMKAVFADFANQAKQSTLTEFRRAQGSEEVIKTYQNQLIGEVERRLRAGEDLADVGKDLPMYVKANREAVETELFKAVYEKAKEQDPDSVSALDGFAEQEGLTTEHWKNLAQAAMNAVANGTKKTALSEILESETIDAIPADSKLRKAADEFYRKKYMDELKAREIESKTPTNAPKTPSGGATQPMTRTQLDGMSSDERMNYLVSLNDDERARMWDVAMAE